MFQRESFGILVPQGLVSEISQEKRVMEKNRDVWTRERTGRVARDERHARHAESPFIRGHGVCDRIIANAEQVHDYCKEVCNWWSMQKSTELELELRVIVSSFHDLSRVSERWESVGNEDNYTYFQL